MQLEALAALLLSSEACAALLRNAYQSQKVAPGGGLMQNLCQVSHPDRSSSRQKRMVVACSLLSQGEYDGIVSMESPQDTVTALPNLTQYEHNRSCGQNRLTRQTGRSG